MNTIVGSMSRLHPGQPCPPGSVPPRVPDTAGANESMRLEVVRL